MSNAKAKKVQDEKREEKKREKKIVAIVSKRIKSQVNNQKLISSAPEAVRREYVSWNTEESKLCAVVYVVSGILR